MRDPGVAAVLSAIIPRIGQVYNGRFLASILWLIITPGLWIGTGGLRAALETLIRGLDEYYGDLLYIQQRAAPEVCGAIGPESGAQHKGRSPHKEAPARSSIRVGYLRRSFSLPFFSFAVPFLWPERPSAFLLSSLLRAPAASLGRPLALSNAPSPLSCLLLFLLPTYASLLSLLDATLVHGLGLKKP
jgi:hypothetical protein